MFKTTFLVCWATVSRMMLLITIVLGSISVQASIISETPEPLYNMSESELFRMLQQQNMVFNGSNFNSITVPVGLKQQIGDQKALAFIGQILSSGDPRAPNALANYIQRYPNDLLGFYLAATELIKQEKFPEAELTLQKISQSSPDFHAATNLIGLIRISQQQYNVASQIFARVLLRDQQPNGMAARYMAWLGIKKGNVAQAEKALRMTIDKMPQPVTQVSPILLELAELLRRQEKYDEVYQLLAGVESSSTPDEATLEALSRRFEAATSAGMAAEAEATLVQLQGTEAIESFPVLLGQARLSAQKNDFNQALLFIEQAKSEGANFEAIRLLEKSRILAVSKQTNKAVEALNQYLTVSDLPSTAQWKNYTDVMLLLGKGNVAVSNIRASISESKSTELSLLLVDTLVNAGDILGGTREVQKLLAQQPSLSPALFRYGVLLFDKGENDQAADAFRNAVESDPQNIPAWMALFGALHDHRVHNHASGMAATDHQDLMPLFDEAIAANPDSTLLYYEKGLTAYSGSELNEAKLAFDRAVVIAPFDVPSLAMAAIVRADIDAKPEESLALAKRGEQLDPNNPAVMDAVGWALIQNKRIDEGLIYLNKALQMMPGDEAVLAHMVEAYIAQGKKDQSIDYIYDALKGILPDHMDANLRQHLIALKPMTELRLQVNLVNTLGVGDSLGEILITEVSGGVRVEADVSALPEGLNGMHFHEKPSCDVGIVAGERVTGHAAGGHYGHDHMMMDMGEMDMSNMSMEEHMKHMQMMKPKGDLPPLPIGANGQATEAVFGANLTIDELRGRTLMIHQGPDTDGESGPKIACAVIP